MPNPMQWAASRARQRLYASLRKSFHALGFEEVETPILVPTPGMEPHIDPFETPFVPETGVGVRRPLYLHTSPEYAMKRLLADGSGPLFQLCKVFRNGEISGLHNPEFTLLEFYRPHATYQDIMADVERVLSDAEAELSPQARLFRELPYERLTVRQALLRETGIDLRAHPDARSLRAAAEGIGVRISDKATGFDDVFFQLFLERVEPKLGHPRPTFLIDYPSSMASLARLKPGDPSVAERVELYAGGVELANGFSELTDATEQRRRLTEEQAQRRAAGRPAFELDERFLQALPNMPPSAGIAVGLDRILMLLLGAKSIDEVLLFPAREFA
ncbi:MAG: EF-P lysine aminoacylase EpmA [Myxococcaceae bacterium]